MKKCITVISCFILFIPQLVQAAEFDKNFIISDSEINNVDSMTLGEIAEFLHSKNSTLSYVYPEDYDGVTRTVPEIIWLASQRYQINPKYTLVLLQKEQSLIEKQSPSQRDMDWATGYAVCDSCSTADTSIQKYKGFGKQVDNGVGFMRFFFDNPQKASPFLIGAPTKVTDKNNGTSQTYEITPVNQSTANLYKYTPHYSGNFSFWNIWQRYFSQEYPNGTLVTQVGDNTVWLIQSGKKRAFKSYGILVSRYSSNKIVTITKADLDLFPEGKPISFPQYSYLRAPSGTVFLLIDDKRYGFASQSALRIIGINPEEIVDVTWAELEPYTEGNPITTDSEYPTGALLQDNVLGGIYYVQNGKKTPIWTREILDARFPNAKSIPVHPDELATYETLAPLALPDGELVRSYIDPAVYVIEEGKRRPIVSGELFEKLGYNWSNVIVVSEQTILLHPLGEPLK